MVVCAYCERPLICEDCGASYVPQSEAFYQALSRSDVPITCHACGVILVCHWCKTPYDGLSADDALGE